MSFPPINNATLSSLTPNLDVGKTADPALRLAYFQYLNTYLTSIINQLNSAVASSSGSESIGSASITGVTGATVYAQLVSLQANIQTVIAGSIPPSSVSTAMIQDLAVTTAKLALQAVGTAQLADSSVTAAKLAPNSITYTNADAATQANLVGGQIYAYKNMGGF